MAAAVQSPHLHVIDRLFQIPMFNCAYNTGADVYKSVKSRNKFLGWTLGCAEDAACLGLSAVTPVAHTFQGPIQLMDSALCKGLDVVQDKVPIINKPAQEIYEDASQYVSHTSQYVGQATVTKVHDIKTASLKKANEVLTTTSVGSVTLASLDKTVFIADQVIDMCLPAGEGEENVHPHPSSECEDKVSHAAHTVATLSVKVGRRVIRSLSRRNSTLSIQSDARTISDDETSVHSSDEE